MEQEIIGKLNKTFEEATGCVNKKSPLFSRL
jgi:hypothetical protein